MWIDYINNKTNKTVRTFLILWQIGFRRPWQYFYT
jgi:hypothetical protein